ncbi:GTPase RsgA [Marinomonas rhizomae]|uniref:Ribosome biogenesis GTPase n=1 Tax=Marinomonas rhizomae TaxID=491948 RepID=A0A366JFB2_9GAMM|nr:GTPase RsgA [Marinomonas rhizomae]RBP85633.1 ribosome biogenesis GTPase [Marinomonas rhizomae]RNF75739.1 GTPase RsgA [Marinomonas rhizomae]
MDATFTLLDLGWQAYFQQQLSLDDLESNRIARICSKQDSKYELVSEFGFFTLENHSDLPNMAVGDWLVTDTEQNVLRLLEPSSVFEGIASNIDTVFLMCALNQDFNLTLIKRYLELTHNAQADAVVILTKADTCDDAAEKRAQVEKLDPLLIVETVNALDASSLRCLSPLLKKGKTIALLGAVGSGKSALINTLMQATEEGKTQRNIGDSGALKIMPSGAILLDTKGMRELQLAEFDSSSIANFADIIALEKDCRFSDCHHQGEPDCAIKGAVKANRLDEQRVADFMLLRNEDNDDDQVTKSKPQEKFYRSAQSDIRARKHSSAE